MGGASAPPFFRHFPFKIGDLEAHPGKICLPLILICLPLVLIRGRQRKIMRRVGKIGRQKVFPKVKSVNVESPKIDSKLLDFWSGSLPQPLPKGKGFSNFDIRLYMRVYITPPWKCFGRRCVGFVFRLVYSFAYARCVGFETPQCMVQCIVCV